MNKAGLVNYSMKWAGKPWGEKFGFAVPVCVCVFWALKPLARTEVGHEAKTYRALRFTAIHGNRFNFLFKELRPERLQS